MNYFNVITEIMVLMAYILIGYLARKLKIITEQSINDINRLIVNVALPMLILKSMNIEYKQEYVRNMLQISLTAFCFLLFTFMASGKMMAYTKAEPHKAKSMRYCMIFGNIALLGYPLCNALFGEIGMFYASLYVIVQNLYVWTAGIKIFTKEKVGIANLKRLINPGTVAIALGLIMFFLNIRPIAPVGRVIAGVGSITIPLALIMIGATLYGYRIREIVSDSHVQLVTLFKVLIFPLAFLSILYFVPIDQTIKVIFVVLSAAPVQVSAAAYAMTFGGDAAIPAKGVFLSTILCLVTIPFFLFLINL